MFITYELEEGAKVPCRAHSSDAGLDLYANEDKSLSNTHPVHIHTGVHMLIPAGCVGLICPRSGLTRQGKVAEIGVVDAGFTGEICVTMRYEMKGVDEWNGKLQRAGAEIERGDRIAQLVVLPVEMVNLMPGDVMNADTERGSSGFGSTGK